ncbi:MAG: hypothetical protein HKO67_12985 [Flavobacteriaceae bacterium]|nr:hypothetical protein [Flavobacteriaceae bacterium]NNL81396.1 hypothetical protein [Flavobacteriaceae bacterium]
MKKLLSVLLVVIIAGSVWYFFIKDFNYIVRFEANHAKGTVHKALSLWKANAYDGVDSVYIQNSDPFTGLEQKVWLKDHALTYRWKIKTINDSVSKVVAYIKDDENSVKRNWEVIFGNSEFVDLNLQLLQKISGGINVLNERYTIQQSDSIQYVESRHCAYISLESSITNKAQTMMNNIQVITSYLKSNNIPISDDPFLQVTSIDFDNDKMTFDFCFPVTKSSRYPQSQKVSFKDVEGFNALKATYYGNYSRSDHAWFRLMEIAERKQVEINQLPIEIYRDDPHNTPNELSWQADVFMPLK